jgi:DNA-binding response OmpR family regulator
MALGGRRRLKWCGQFPSLPLFAPGYDTFEVSTAEAFDGKDPNTRLRVLLVDDDPDTTEALEDVFAEFACELRVAHDGRSAIKEAVRFRPRLVVLDIGLPDKDGFDVARAMREGRAARDLWLVALTGFHDPRIRVLAQGAGFDDYLVKPIDALSVEGIVREARGLDSRR